MRWANFLFGLLVIATIAALLVYFFIPVKTIEFNPEYKPGNSNFNLDNSTSGMQFYENMRYQENEISYKISNECSLVKKNEMESALEIISNLTVLEFYPVVYGEEISVTCTDENIVQGNTFIGGEGGVTNVTVIDGFHVIFNGKILLIKDSKCTTPNIAIHELLHALGFTHSENPNNIMYETYECGQTIGDEIPEFIDEIYSIPSKPDLSFESVDANLNGRYLDANLSLRNNGFKNSPASKIIISVDGKTIKEVEVPPVEIGYGRKISLSNLFVTNINVEKIEFILSGDFDEISKENNVYTLNVK
jgi:hypothetical protein